MKIQRIHFPGQDRLSWCVIDDHYLPIQPIHEFLVYLENLERSPHTVRAYACHLRLYWAYLQDSHLEWTQVGLSELAEFVSWLREPCPEVTSIQPRPAKRSEATINAILTAVTMFYDYHERRDATGPLPLYRYLTQPRRRYKGLLYHITKSKPVKSRLLKLKVPKYLPQTLTDEQVQQIIQACHRLRDKFLVSLLYESGIRIGQLLGLHHEDIEAWGEEPVISIVPRDDNSNGARAKKKESYRVYVSPGLMALYADYLTYEFDQIASDYVFVSIWEGEIGRPLTYGAVLDLFRRLSKATGVYVRPHMLRHTHATRLIRNGVPMAHVQKRLGHADIQTTINTYVHLTDEDMKQAYQDYLQKRKR